MSVMKFAFGEMPDGQSIERYRLRNANGCQVGLITFGAAIQSFEVPDRFGQLKDIVLGYKDINGYLGPTNPRHGATIGRVANRVRNGRFNLNGQIIELSKNKDPHHMHGGFISFDKRIWTAEIIRDGEDLGEDPCVRFSLFSADGEEGYPGNLQVSLTYTLTQDNALRLDYEAVADQATAINLTNHVYFNLAGHERSDINGHIVQIEADAFTVIDANCYPTGEIRPVEGTALDFRTPRPIGFAIDADEEQMHFAKGYDFNYVLRGEEPRIVSGANPTAPARTLKRCAVVYEPVSGRKMTVETTSPGVQFYTANNMKPGDIGKGGATYLTRGSYCLETQHFPDAVNHTNFPNAIYQAGDVFRETTIYRLAVE
ncbi:MAG: galactose mutarotase [Eubacteriales bacterium]|nr:galactose mutarotase [Eubacteriales bacterium]